MSIQHGTGEKVTCDGQRWGSEVRWGPADQKWARGCQMEPGARNSLWCNNERWVSEVDP